MANYGSRRKYGKKQQKKDHNTIIGKQTANASIEQGGNSIAINASDVGIVRIRPPRG
ncbi:hypothetical protein [Paenibacillus flagellatus]|uniref:hypothetical protein n=1 Tax=Paenibacillus flagellatus TaxID=2211139 RepID=UPI0014745CA8|nr:hypothetical protein [Paenibacillus flagellatus]